MSWPHSSHYGHKLIIRGQDGTKAEDFGDRSSYSYQLNEVAEVLRGGRTIRTPAEAGLATMRVMDDVYRAAGLQPRGA